MTEDRHIQRALVILFARMAQKTAPAGMLPKFAPPAEVYRMTIAAMSDAINSEWSDVMAIADKFQQQSREIDQLVDQAFNEEEDDEL